MSLKFKFRFNLIVLTFFMHECELTDGIIAGKDAQHGEFPFVVSLRNETNKHYCGGSLISRHHILTAAHCLFTDRSAFDYESTETYEPSVIKAVVDTVSGDGFHGEFYQAAKLSPHPRYNITDPYSIFHDIGIVELNREIVNEKVIPIALPTKHVIYEKTATVVGWGIDDRGNIEGRSQTARVLQKVDMQVMRPDICIDIYLEKVPQLAYTAEALFLGTAFCSAHDRANVCYRDSGSPLIQDGTLAGIVIFGNECKEGYPDIFTSVFYYLDYILDGIGDRCTPTDVRKLLERTSL